MSRQFPDRDCETIFPFKDRNNYKAGLPTVIYDSVQTCKQNYQRSSNAAPFSKLFLLIYERRYSMICVNSIHSQSIQALIGQKENTVSLDDGLLSETQILCRQESPADAHRRSRSYLCFIQSSAIALPCGLDSAEFQVLQVVY